DLPRGGAVCWGGCGTRSVPATLRTRSKMPRLLGGGEALRFGFVFGASHQGDGRFVRLELGEADGDLQRRLFVAERVGAVGGRALQAARDLAGFGKRAAGQQGDEFAVFEASEVVHFAER